MILPSLLAPPAAFAVDLFLVGSCPAPIADLKWLDPERAANDAPIQATLRARLAPLIAANRTFVVMEGPDGSVFATAKPWSSVGYLKRDYNEYDSMTETVNGKTHVLEHTSVNVTETGGVSVGRNGPMRYVSQSFLHFGTAKGHPMIALMDLNSYREALAHGQPQDKQYLPLSILFSDDSTVQTRHDLAEMGIRPPGPVICRTGIPRARDRDVFCFPPEGVVGHYRLVQGAPGWRLEFVEFIRAAS